MKNHIEKKYEFTGETMEFEGHTLQQIRYLRNVSVSMKTGDIGGWVEGEHNLSHEGTCRIIGHAKVFGDARVMDSACIMGHAIVKDNVQIKNKAIIHDKAIVGADTIVSDTTWIGGDSNVYFYADEQYGRPNISGDSEIDGETTVEATGVIHESNIYHSVLFGNLNLIEVVWEDENFSK